MTELVVGVDGGGSKTQVAVSRFDGRVLAECRGGASNIYDRHMGEALSEVASLILRALNEAGADISEVAMITVSIAGADWPEDFDDISAWMGRRFSDTPVQVINDAVGGLYAYIPTGPGVVVVLGTGVATASRGTDNQIWHSSFWQGPGGTQFLAEAALQGIYRAELGLEPSTTLSQIICELYGQDTIEGVLHETTRRGGSVVHQYSKMAPLVLTEADGGDAVACRIVERMGISLAEYAHVAAIKVGISGSAFPIGLNGGLMRAPSRVLLSSFNDYMATREPLAICRRCEAPPLAGALVAAIEQTGVAVDATILRGIQGSLHAFGREVMIEG